MNQKKIQMVRLQCDLFSDIEEEEHEITTEREREREDFDELFLSGKHAFNLVPSGKKMSSMRDMSQSLRRKILVMVLDNEQEKE